MKIGFLPALNGLFRIYAATKAIPFVAVSFMALLLGVGLFAPVQSANISAQEIPLPVARPGAEGASVQNDSAPQYPANPDLILENCTDISPLTVPVLQAPANNSQLDTLLPVFMWEIDQAMVSENMHVELEVALDPQFNNIVQTMFAWHALEASLSGQLSFNLNPGTVYYWRARLNCQAGQFQQGPLSPVYSFTTGANGVLLPAPVLLTPLNGSEVMTGTIVLEWQPVGGALEYLAYWDYGTSGRGAVTAETKVSVLAPVPGVEYSWRVSARNDYAFGTVSDSWVFTTTSVAPKPSTYIYLPAITKQ